MKFEIATAGLIAIAAVLVEPSTASPTYQKVGECIGSERVKLPACDLQRLGEAKLGDVTCDDFAKVIREHDWEAYTNCTDVLVPKVATCSSLDATSIVPPTGKTLKRLISESIGAIGALLCNGPNALEECDVDCLNEVGLTISGETGDSASVSMHSLALLAVAGAVVATSV